MSKYNVLQSKNAFSPWLSKNQEDIHKAQITQKQFFKWTSDHLFQSTYDNHFAHRNLNPPHDSAIPGYQGYMPYVVPQNMHARRKSQLSRECYDKLNGQPFNGLSSTGYNLSMDKHIDTSKQALSSKYGKSAIGSYHPGWRVGPLISTTKDTYRNPLVHLNPTFDPTPAKQYTKKHQTSKSGYQTNYNSHDRKGWLNHPVLNAPRNESQYRRRFGPKKQLTRQTRILTERTPFHKQKGGIV